MFSLTQLRLWEAAACLEGLRGLQGLQKGELTTTFVSKTQIVFAPLLGLL